MGLFARKNIEDQDIYTPGYEDDEEYFGLGQSIERPVYGRPEIDFMLDNASSKWLPGVIDLVNGRQITQKFKASLTTALSELLGPDELKANNTPTKLGFAFKDHVHINLIEADLILWYTIVDAMKSDLITFNAMGMFTSAKKDYKALQSRTYGKDRERKIMTEFRTVSTNINEVNRPDREIPQPKKKGLLASLFGR
jgi:hypothetical protein